MSLRSLLGGSQNSNVYGSIFMMLNQIQTSLIINKMLWWGWIFGLKIDFRTFPSINLIEETPYRITSQINLLFNFIVSNNDLFMLPVGNQKQFNPDSTRDTVYVGTI